MAPDPNLRPTTADMFAEADDSLFDDIDLIGADYASAIEGDSGFGEDFVPADLKK